MTLTPRTRWLLMFALVVMLTSALGCAEIILGDDNDSNDGSLTGPSGTDDGNNGNGNGGPVAHDFYIVEYRVTGTATQVVVRARHPDDGFNQVTTGLPFSASVQTNADTVFVSLEATAISFVGTPYLNAQIFVDGVLFREAFTTQIGTTVQVTATYRRPED
jgi:hypothetical protein